MTFRLLTLGLLILVLMLWGGCDSGQYGQETKTEPKTDKETMTEAETPAAAAQGALMAPEGSAGGAENDEGVDHYKLGHWDVAQEHFQKALGANSDLAEAHYNLALALDKQGSHGEATKHFKEALELAPVDPRIRDSGILQSHVGG